jgi:hypothetical protein
MSGSLSAAQRLQQAHDQAQAKQRQEQEQTTTRITEDPFPSLVLTEDPFPVSNNNYAKPGGQQGQQQSKKQVDVNNEEAFPSLGGAPPVKQVSGGWGGGLSSKVKTAVTPSAQSSFNGTPPTPVTTSGGGGGDSASLNFSIPTSSIHITSPSSGGGGGRNNGGLFSNDPRLKSGPPTTLGEVLKHLTTLPHNLQKSVEIQASSSSKLTTFIIKASINKKVSSSSKTSSTAQEEVERVKNELLGWLEKKVKEEVKVPKSLRAVIIGAKGTFIVLS